MPDPSKQLTPEIKLEKYEWVVPMNSRHYVHLNPLVYGEFKKTTATAREHVTAYFLDDLNTQLGIFWADDGEYGVIKLTESTSEGTAIFSLGLLCAKYPALKVEKGRVRPFPAVLKPYESTHALILTVTNIDSVPSKSRHKAKSTNPPAAGNPSPPSS